MSANEELPREAKSRYVAFAIVLGLVATVAVGAVTGNWIMAITFATVAELVVGFAVLHYSD